MAAVSCGDSSMAANDGLDFMLSIVPLVPSERGLTRRLRYTCLMLIGIISDTHGRLPTAVHAAFAGCERILHSGDIGGERVLDELEGIAPVTAVLGNCDYFGLYGGDGREVSAHALLTLDGTRIAMAHRPLDIQEALRGWTFIPAGQPLPHVCVHGHTHIPKDESAGAVRMLCPGSPVSPRGGSHASVMLLRTLGDGRVEVELVPIV